MDALVAGRKIRGGASMMRWTRLGGCLKSHATVASRLSIRHVAATFRTSSFFMFTQHGVRRVNDQPGGSNWAFLPSAGTTAFFPGFIDSTTGNATFIADAFDWSGSGSGPLAILNFSATGEGTSPLTLANVILLDSTGANIPFTTTNGSVTVMGAVATHEPKTMAGIAVCLLLLASLRVGTRKSEARWD